MARLKLISILLSGCLVTGVGVGNVASNLENIKSMDVSKIIESIYNKSNEDLTEDIEIENISTNTSNETVNDEEYIIKENNEDSTIKEDNKISNEVLTEEETITSEVEKKEKTTEGTIIKPEVSEENNSSETINKEIQSNSQEEDVSKENNNSVTNSEVEASDKFIAEIEQAIFNRVNQERAAAGLSTLQYNTTMEHYARIKSQDMGDRKYFDHANPEGQYITAQMKADGVSYRAWGENIAYISGMSGNSTLATRFMDNWMNSSGHRANILSTNFSSIGVGVYKIGNTYYATQEFYK